MTQKREEQEKHIGKSIFGITESKIIIVHLLLKGTSSIINFFRSWLPTGLLNFGQVIEQSL